MNRCQAFAQMTHSSDEKITLFENLLDNFFEEYSSIYGAMSDTNVADGVSVITYIDNSVEVSFDDNVEITADLLSHLKDYIKEQLSDTHKVKIDKLSEHKILISLNRKG